MDCCNYVPYRESYYGAAGTTSYYNYLHPTGSFYGSPYHEYGYAATAPYYSQFWPCATSFPDYMYNPKEVRIRRAVRDLTKENSRGINAHRKSAISVPNLDEQLMVPSHFYRQPIEAGCSNSDFSEAHGNSFLPTNSYNKLGHILHQESHPNSNYIHALEQGHNMFSLQHESNLWRNYQDITSRSQGAGPYIMPEPEGYMQSRGLEQRNFPQNEKTEIQKYSKRRNLHQNERTEEIFFNNQLYESRRRDKQESITTNQTVLLEETYMKMYDKNRGDPNIYDRVTNDSNTEKPTAPRANAKNKRPSSKPLPDFNEAFGSTERGRFQSPPDPRLVSKGYTDCFYTDTDSSLKFNDYQI